MSWPEYAAGWSALHDGVDPRQSAAVRAWLRVSYVVGRGLAGLSPGAITVIGVVLSALVPIAVLLGPVGLFVAAGLVLLAALADSADGAVAVITGRNTRLGAFFDALADRVTEGLWLLALWLAGVPAVLVVACGALVWLHEYARARAASAGMLGIGVLTVAERPTRVIATVLAFGLGGVAALGSPRLAAGLQTVVVAVWLVLGLLALTRLIGAIRRSLREPVPTRSGPPPAGSPPAGPPPLVDQGDIHVS